MMLQKLPWVLVQIDRACVGEVVTLSFQPANRVYLKSEHLTIPPPTRIRAIKRDHYALWRRPVFARRSGPLSLIETVSSPIVVCLVGIVGCYRDIGRTSVSAHIKRCIRLFAGEDEREFRQIDPRCPIGRNCQAIGWPPFCLYQTRIGVDPTRLTINQGMRRLIVVSLDLPYQTSLGGH